MPDKFLQIQARNLIICTGLSFTSDFHRMRHSQVMCLPNRDKICALIVMLAFGAVVFGGCANLQRREPIEVIVVGVEPLQGQGLELRMLVKLRIQNPNDSPLDFNGVSVQMDVQGKHFATGVSDASGSVPRFGETIVDVPVSASVFRIASQAIDAMTSEFRGKLAYEMTGKLAGPAFNSVSFKSKGELTLPAEIFESGK